MMAWQPRPLYLDEPQPALGPGLSRPLPTESTRLYRLRVKIPSIGNNGAGRAPLGRMN